VIPVTEWKFFEGTEQRIKHLAGHRQENLLALYRGEALPWDPQELAAREAAVLQEFEYPARVEAAFGLDPTPGERRHLELHRRWALGAMFQTHPDLVSLEVPLLERSLRFRPRVGDREVSRPELQAILLTEENRDLREAAYDALAPLGEELEADLTELIRRREMLSRALLETGYPEVILAAREQDRAEVVGLLFDGNYESITADWDYIPAITRSIHVDIRYVLWLMEELDGAQGLLREMGVVAQ